MAIFSRKNARIAQRLRASPPGLHSGNLFSRTQSSQPSIFKIVITRFLNTQMLKQSATITAKPCLPITKLTTMGTACFLKNSTLPPFKNLCLRPCNMDSQFTYAINVHFSANSSSRIFFCCGICDALQTVS